MYITELEICDLRSFRGTQRVSLDRGDGTYAGWTVFAGRNGAGKSTLLKALALSAIGPSTANKLVQVFPRWVRHDPKSGDDAPQFARSATLLSIDEPKDKYCGAGKTTKAPFWTGLEWSPNDTESDDVKLWIKDPSTTREQAPARGPWAETPKGWFIAGYGPYRHLGPESAAVARLSINPVLARLVNLFYEDATLSDAVDWLQQQHTRALEERSGAAQLRDDAIALLGDGLLPDGSTVDRVDSEGLWITRDGVSLTLQHVSDGYRTVAGLVLDLVRRLHDCYGALELQKDEDGALSCPLPGVVLIDEVDAHLHVAWQQEIGFWLTRHFPNVQFLVTTHSPFICQAASPRGLIRLPAPGEEGPMAHVDDALFHAIVHGGADQAVVTQLFGLEHPHSAPAETRQRALASLESKVLRDQATEEELARYQAMTSEYPGNLGDLARRRLEAIVKGSS